MKEMRQRQSLRLRGYDYSQAGAYYVTICTHNRACLFGEVINGEMVLNPVGHIVESEWKRTEDIRKDVVLDAVVVMPNHVHMIVFCVGADRRPPTNHPSGGPQSAPTTLRSNPTTVLGNIFKGFKSATTVKINQHRQTPGTPVWQRGYYDHIVRNDDDLNRIRQYITDNPMQWALDAENPEFAGNVLRAQQQELSR